MSLNDAMALGGAADVKLDDSPPPDDLPPAHKTACLQCRHQKIKCKPSPDGSIVCARCQKMNLSCIYQGRRERTSKVSKDKDTHERAPKRRLLAGEDPSGGLSNIASLPAGPQASSNHSLTHKSPVASSSVTDASPASSSNNLSPSASYHTTDTTSCTIWSQSKKGACKANTHPRRLEKIHVEPAMIEDLFATFFLYYAVDVPILDAMLSPNDYYNRSPLLFWSIMSVASRRYTSDPTLLQSLAAATFKLALHQVDSPSADIHTVEALLLLLTWQFPTNSMHEEAGYILSGAMIHLALKFGLHTAEAGQDYVRVRLTLDECEIKRRRILWAACAIVYQEVCTMLGNTCLQLPTALISKAIPRLTCSDPRLRLQVQGIITRANNAFAENGTAIDNAGEERTLQLLIRAYGDELKTVEAAYESLTGRERLFITYAHMQLQVMHLFRPADRIEHCTLANLYSTAVRLIEQLSELDRDCHYTLYTTAYVTRSAALASCILLRLIKTPFGEAIDLDEAKAFFLTSLQLLQKMTVANNDGPARAAVALSRLWRSDRVFKDASGNFQLGLRVRSRYGPSILWDTMAWCREEFGINAAYPKPPPTNTATTTTAATEMPPPVSAPAQATDLSPPASLALPPGTLPTTSMLLPSDVSMAGIDQIPLSFDWTMDDWFFVPDVGLTGDWGASTGMMEGFSLGL